MCANCPLPYPLSLSTLAGNCTLAGIFIICHFRPRCLRWAWPGAICKCFSVHSILCFTGSFCQLPLYLRPAENVCLGVCVFVLCELPYVARCVRPLWKLCFPASQAHQTQLCFTIPQTANLRHTLLLESLFLYLSLILRPGKVCCKLNAKAYPNLRTYIIYWLALMLSYGNICLLFGLNLIISLSIDYYAINNTCLAFIFLIKVAWLWFDYSRCSVVAVGVLLLCLLH